MELEPLDNRSAEKLPPTETTLTAIINPQDEQSEKTDLRFDSDKIRLRVGRDPQNELFIEKADVSRFHASLLLRPDGRLLIADLDSRNGTQLNGRKLESGQAYEINDNDLLKFGDTEVRLNWAQVKRQEIFAERETSLVFPSAAQEADALPSSALDETQPPPSVPETLSASGNLPGLETSDSPPGNVVAKTEKPAASVARSAGIVSIAVMGSRILGLVREVVFAAVLGAGDMLDAYIVAFRIPNLLRDLFAEGALSVAFVKTFTDYQINRSEAEAWRLASLVFNALVVILSAISLFGILLAPYLIGLIAPGFLGNPEKLALTTKMTQIMFPFLLLVAMAAVAMGVLNTKGIFGIPASASTVFNIVSVLTGLCFAYFLSGGTLAGEWTVIGLSIGTMLGGAAQFAMQIPSLLQVGFRFSPRLSFTDPGVVQVFRLMAPAILGTSAVQINVMVNTAFVSDITGAQGWLNSAFRLMQLPIGIFGVAVATAAIPALSKFAAQKDIAKFRETLGSSMRLVFLLTLPSACGLIVLGEPIIRLLYEHGKFDASATNMTAWALAAYAVGLTGYAAIKIISPAFYALDDARTPMMISLASIVVNAVAGYFFRLTLSQVGVTEQTPGGLGHVGVALATSTIALVNFLALLILLRRKIKRVEGGKILVALAKIGVASGLLSVVSYFSYRLLFNYLGTGNLLLKTIEVFIPIALGGIIFLVTAKLLGVTELNQAYSAFARKLGRQRG